MSAEIINLGDLEKEENSREEFYKYIDGLKESTTRVIIFSMDKDMDVKVASSASDPAELMIMLNQLKKLNEYLIDTYSYWVFAKNNEEAEEDDDEGF